VLVIIDCYWISSGTLTSHSPATPPAQSAAMRSAWSDLGHKLPLPACTQLQLVKHTPSTAEGKVFTAELFPVLQAQYCTDFSFIDWCGRGAEGR
jgi:hypothetical protein